MPILNDELVAAVKRLEPLPPTVARLAALLSQPDWDMDEVEECIGLDQALCPKLLRIANSALWFRGHAVGTVRDAVMRIGSGAAVALAIGAGVQRRFVPAAPGYGLHEGELWAHSVAALLATTKIDAATKVELPGEAATAALLHDLGKLVIARVAPPEAQRRILDRMRLQHEPQCIAEVDVLGLDHAALGGVAAVHWRLPERIVTGICYHEAPLTTQDPIAAVVHVADAVAKRAQALTAPAGGDAPAEAQPEALELLALRSDRLDALAAEVGEELADVLRRYA